MSVVVKICGLKTPEALEAAIENGADMVGFNFFERTPRFVGIDNAMTLSEQAVGRVMRVGLVVNADDEELSAILNNAALDMLQLHGSETLERVSEIKARFCLPVMKVCAISDQSDIENARAYEGVADYMLFDAKPPKDADRPGGNAVAFDWQLLANETWKCPWMLAGGLAPENVAEAIRISGAPGVDVSSGVEDAPGEKNVQKIAAFLKAAKA